MLNRLHGISRQIQAFFTGYDMLLTPTLAEPPVKLGVLDMMTEDAAAFSERLWRYTPFTYPFNVTGQPAMSVPLAWNGDGLPIGVQFVGRYGDEAGLYRLAGQLERARPWADRRPPDPA
jgi:Asp-tRNA(Asn)/Glu-tRNA(Gln) amidotransferase A subunit family amidase